MHKKYLAKIGILFFIVLAGHGIICSSMEKLNPEQIAVLKLEEEKLMKYFRPSDISYFKRNLPEIKKRKGNAYLEFVLSEFQGKSGKATFDFANQIVAISKTTRNGAPIKEELVLYMAVSAFEYIVNNALED